MTWQEGLLPTAAANIRGVHLEKENKTDVFNTPEFGFTVSWIRNLMGSGITFPDPDKIGPF
jgi:hypothetical protein